MKLKNPFRRKNKYASPYYGGSGALFHGTNVPLRPIEEPKEEKNVTAPVPVAPAPKEPTEPDWEQRRFELVSRLMCQERRSVILGKLRANDKQIVAKARSIADAAIKELQTHPFKSYEEADRGAE